MFGRKRAGTRAGRRGIGTTGETALNGVEVAFLLGVPRSGTTLLSYLLDRHPEVAVPPEPWLLLALESFGKVCARHPASSHYLGQAILELGRTVDLDPARRQFAHAAYAGMSGGKRIVVDKTPRYYHVLGTLDRLFPASRLIHLRRNPFAVAASLKTSWGLDIVSTLTHLPDHPLIIDFVLGPRLYADHAAMAGPRAHVLRYEDLVAAPERHLSDLFAHLGVSPVPLDLRVEAGRTALASASLGDRRILETSAIQRDGLDRWRAELTPDEVQTVLDCVGTDLLVRLGYADALDAARDCGAVPSPPAVTEDIVTRVQGAWAMRGRDVERAATAAGVSDALTLAVDFAFARPDDVLAAMREHDRRGGSP